ncbi:MAG: pilus assembly protein CpaF [Gammaproteobacteria bacterium]|nr:MAG: pilus assembly protein CpaF [Gammaproteobacteria bacterium]
MSDKLKILLSGKSVQLTAQVESLLNPIPGYDVTAQSNRDSNSPLITGSTMPDLIILAISEDWRDELNELAEIPGHHRPFVLIIGSDDQRDAMRMAMRVGAKDFLSNPVNEQELLDAVKTICHERNLLGNKRTSKMTVVMNAKGGSGATMLACNIATIMSQHLKSSTALVDLDVQFGSLPLYFDMMPDHSILEALDIIGSLDPVGLDGFMMQHQSGLRILGSRPEKVVLSDEVAVDRLGLLLDMLQQDNDEVVVDVPRQIDHITTTALERADRIIIVTQQTLTHIRDTVRLLGILKDELLIPDDRIQLVVNRYDKASVVTIDDINKTLQADSAFLIPNDYKNVMQSENIGIPLNEYAKNSLITSTLIELTEQLLGKVAEQKDNLFLRVITNLARSK